MAEKTTKGKTRESYSHAILDAKKDKRRVEAESRQKAHSKLSTAEKIKKAKARMGESKRELARLEAQLATEKEAKKAAPKPEPKAEKTVKKPRRKRS